MSQAQKSLKQSSNKRIPCEIYSRVVGYLRPIQDWNPGKQQEFEERVMYKMPNTEGRAIVDLSIEMLDVSL